MTNQIQIDVPVEQNTYSTYTECVLLVNGVNIEMLIPTKDYRSLVKNNFFVRNGRSVDGASMKNTTKVFLEKEELELELELELEAETVLENVNFFDSLVLED